ncbi:MAG: sigma-70 family RNA polymerase sigma factor [Acidisphaera sp.]|nr:sigma-70 family RNA polymerase sigma factor [Acidisphaera sp.]MBV9813941.1 sigma-70 family RNA polymerase sigma factor [Acetobacteraceae bacterium]
MAAAQDGDTHAYRRLLTEIAPVLRALVRRQRVAPGHVEDVVQDVLLAVHRVRHTYDPALPFLPWLAAIARRRAIDKLRMEGRRAARIDPDSDILETFSDPAANAPLENRELQQWLAEAIAKLPPRQRRALELVKLQEMSIAEAARATGQSEGAIKVSVHRALRAMRTLLREG